MSRNSKSINILKEKQTDRGFKLIEFKDLYKTSRKCQSSNNGF
ncbi:hypothetical protein [Clostridium botulinum]|nr:hypothetical protein [Clostridium botulinum]